jgi:hypothetical protein
MIDTPLGILLALFQEDKWWWAVEDEDRQRVDCRFCGGTGERPESVQHLQFCVIELAARMIQSDENLMTRVMRAPPRHVYKGTATLTVYRRNGKVDDR